MTALTLGMAFCDTGKVRTKEERLEWPVIDEERGGEKGWRRFKGEQICRMKIRRMKDEWAQNLAVRPWCISKVIKVNEVCTECIASGEAARKYDGSFQDDFSLDDGVNDTEKLDELIPVTAAGSRNNSVPTAATIAPIWAMWVIENCRHWVCWRKCWTMSRKK